MCGICGEWSQHGASIESLRAMTSAIRHRGPDDDGYFVEACVGMANCRLSIIDLDNGRQPISNEDGTATIVFNGEIYNYRALRQVLIERGHQFKTESDTEVILHLYDEYGLDCVEHLRGMFAFAIWDSISQRLFLARDPLGQKPLYYALERGVFLFASEIKALLHHSRITPMLHTRAMHHFISIRCVPESDTLFEGISKVPPGHTLVFERGSLALDRFWSLRYHPKLAETESQIIGQLRELLLETVGSHMVSDVPVGAFLSGGIDSSLIVAMMCQQSSQPIKTFSVGVREQDFNELPYARMVAEKFGTDHHELIVEPGLMTALPDMLWHMEEPVDPFAFGVHSVARLASEHVKVVLGGDGGDEMFAGYDRYLGNQLVDLYCLLPRSIRRHLIEPMIKRLPDNFGYNNRVQKLRWLVAMSETTAGERYAHSASFLRFSHAHKQSLYTDLLWRNLSDEDSSTLLSAIFDDGNATNSIDRMLNTDVRTRLGEHLLMVADRMTMAHSLEARSPYVDQRVAEFAAAMPATMKIRGRRLKHALREVARDFLPEPLIDRRKQGFSFPLARWFAHELRDLVSNVLGNSSLVAAGYFRSEAISTLLDEHMTRRMDHNYRLWLLLNLEFWHRMFVEGQSFEAIRETIHRSGVGQANATRLDGRELVTPHRN